MNTDDAEAPEVTDDRLVMIFARQGELMTKYVQIEKANGIGKALLRQPESRLDGGVLWPVNVNDRYSQYVLKDFAWRVTEEITEAVDVTRGHVNHKHEEAADALHFMVELCILAGLSPNDVFNRGKFSRAYLQQPGSLPLDIKTEGMDLLGLMFAQTHAPHSSTIQGVDQSAIEELAAYDVVHQLGRAMQCLKNKPWKQTHMETDVDRFRMLVAMAFRAMVAYMKTIKMTADDCYDFYFRKSEVNRFRQRSAY